MKRFLLALLAAAAFGACYDANGPNLPPCSPGATWPDPCAGTARDGGRG